jgi:hypothetical protein
LGLVFLVEVEEAAVEEEEEEEEEDNAYRWTMSI